MNKLIDELQRLYHLEQLVGVEGMAGITSGESASLTPEFIAGWLGRSASQFQFAGFGWIGQRHGYWF